MKHRLLLLFALVGTLPLAAQTFGLRAFDQPEHYDLTVSGRQDITLNIGGYAPGDYCELVLRDNDARDYVICAYPAGFVELSPNRIAGVMTGPELDICLAKRDGRPGTLTCEVRKNSGSTKRALRGDKMGDFTVRNSLNMDEMLRLLFRNESCFEYDSLFMTRYTRELGFLGFPPETQAQTGIFENGEIFGMESGIILTTGYVSQADNSNNSVTNFSHPDSLAFASGNWPENDFGETDSLALSMADNPKDVVTFQFTFVPTTDSLKFNYVFFSEEYCIGLGQNFNDAFRFELSGGPEGTRNLAVLADGRPVEVNTVNQVSNADQFVYNNPPDDLDGCPPPAMPPPSRQLASIVYDGFTKKLTARADVTPCETYTLKLMVVDNGGPFNDLGNDSGVFLEAGSFIAGLISPPEPAVSGVPGVLTPVEGCDSATIIFSRLFNTPADLAVDQPVFYEAQAPTGLPAATQGVDYLLPPPPFIIPAGQMSDTMVIPILNDADFGEGQEAFIIYYEGTCNCDFNRDTFYIQNNDGLTIDFGGDRAACAGDTVRLTPTINGGNGSYVLDWGRPLDDSTRYEFVFSGSDTILTLNGRDGCGQTGSGSVTVTAPDAAASIGGSFSLCNAPLAQVPLTISGSPLPLTVVVEVDSAFAPGRAISTYHLFGDTVLTYDVGATVRLLSVENGIGCGGSVTGEARIIATDFSAAVTRTDPDCPGASTGSLGLTLNGGNANYDFAWSDGGPPTPTRDNLPGGSYTLTVTDAADASCDSVFSFVLTAPAPLASPGIQLMDPSDTLCQQANFELALPVSGGVPPYDFAWYVGPQRTLRDSDSLLVGVSDTGYQVYYVEVSDDCGAQFLDTLAFTIEPFTVNLGGRYSLCDPTLSSIPLTVNGPDRDYRVELEFRAENGTTNTVTRTFANRRDDLPVTGPGTYRIRSVAPLGPGSLCPGFIGDTTATIVDPQLNFTATVNDTVCNGQTDGSITLFDNATVPVNYRWADGSTDSVRTDLPPGTYSVTISDRADVGCRDSMTFTIVERAPLSVSLGAGGASCANEPETLAPVVLGGRPPYTYEWVGRPDTTASINFVTEPGTTTYTVRVTDACGATNSAFVTYDNPTITASLSGTYEVCSTGSTSVQIQLAGSNNYTIYLRENGVPRSVTTNTNPLTTAYTEAVVIELDSVIGDNGCRGTATGLARVIDQDYVVTPTITPVACRGEATGAISLDVNGDPGAYRYTWAPASLSGPNPTGLEAGSYTVTIRDTIVGTCTEMRTFVVEEPAELSVTIAAPDPDCPLELVDLAPVITGGTAPFTYDWQNGGGSDSLFPVLTQPGATTYNLELTDACGTLFPTSVDLTLPNITARLLQDTVYNVCNGPVQVIVLTTMAPPYNLIVRENGVPRQVSVTNASDGNLLLSYDTPTELRLDSVWTPTCPGTVAGTATVIDADWAVSALVEDVVCRGDSSGSIDLSVSSTATAYRYRWSDLGPPTEDRSGLRAGPYGLVITSDDGYRCRFDTSFVVSQPAGGIELVRDSIRPAGCDRPGYLAVEYSAAAPPVSYAWADGSGDPLRGEVPAGDYALTVTDANGCEFSTVYTVADRSRSVVANVTVSDSVLNCTRDTIALTANSDVGLPIYEWTGPDGSLLSRARSLRVGATGTYRLLVTDTVTNCRGLGSFTVRSERDTITLDYRPGRAITCTELSVDLSATTDFPGDFTAGWTARNGAPATSDSLRLIGVLNPGIYELTTVRADNGCVSRAQFSVVTDQAEPTITLPPDPAVLSCADPEVALSVDGGPHAAVRWSVVDGNISGPRDSAVALVNRVGRYRATVTDTTTGCFATTVVDVSRNAAELTPVAGTDAVLVCNGAGTRLAGSVSPRPEGTELRWIGPGGELVAEGEVAFATSAGTYRLEAVHPVSGCVSADELTVRSEAPTAVRFELTQPPCPEVGGNLVVRDVSGGSAPYTYSSPTGLESVLGDGLIDLEPGTHVLTVTDARGCTYEENFQIFAAGELTGRAEEVTVRIGETVTLGGTTNRAGNEIVGWQWSNVPDTAACLICPNPEVRPTESFLARAVATDIYGCQVEITQRVVVNERELVYVPNVFSPGNQDGTNDRLTVFGRSEFVQGVDYLRIYDRWGQQVFVRERFGVNDPSAGWDGTVQGRPAPSAAYVYVAQVTLYDGTVQQVTGTVIVAR